MNIKKNMMDGACGTQWEQEKCINGFGGERSGKELLGRP
jgi:hypothetical protein